ncbi:DeoR/GlpR family DNA-binding transcription regulator [Oenococcus alcoholitolerans]|uniref:DeoR/GlpR family DNA-binding transcription regulator n=1 Tax=Oenococcus alcoholitolerans TaxID=931074 RepID=UPI003F702F02
MLIQKRQGKLLDVIKKRRMISLKELKDVSQTSLSTVRRDLEDLERSGKVRRIHGGVKIVESLNTEPSVLQKSLINQEGKHRIAQLASEQLKGGEIIFLDAGTTTGEMIHFLASKDPSVSVVTNSVHHASKLSDLLIPVTIIGGQVKLNTDATIGAAAVERIKQLSFDVGFIGINGISKKFGLTTPDIEEAAVKQAVVQRSRKVYVLADSSKIDVISYAKAVDLEKVSLITEGLSSEQRSWLTETTNLLEADKK